MLLRSIAKVALSDCERGKAAAYYYHGLILDEGNTEKSHGMAVAALQAADEYFKESKRACEVFNAAHPLSSQILFQKPNHGVGALAPPTTRLLCALD
ncbi:hypothetical protein Goari_023917 [Gossypium aridum]|uniref:BRO1 domain-containing protein n=1 Tax=Gossypium aridum TaxID=34290 RepID=A0A7J8X515_GOSAI|nr:hypothetical protein [Gossypium aridum]